MRVRINKNNDCPQGFRFHPGPEDGRPMVNKRDPSFWDGAGLFQLIGHYANIMLNLKVRLDNGGAVEHLLVPGGFKNEVLANQATRRGSSTRCRSWGRGPWRRVKRLSGRET